MDRDDRLLPSGWAWVHFGEVVEHRLGKMLDKAKNRGTLRPYLRNVNVRWHDFDLSDVLEMRLEDDELEEYSVRRGDVLICEGGEPGRSAVWQREEPMAIQKALHRARTRGAIEPKLIVYLLEDAARTGRLTGSFTGSTIQHLTGQALAEFGVPLPPLAEQRRIVAKLDELLSDVDAGVEALQAAKRDLARYRKSVLKAAVEGDLTAAWHDAHGPATEPADALLARILTERRARWEADQQAKYAAKDQTPPKGWQSRYPEPAAPDTSDLPDLPEGWTWASMDQLTVFGPQNGMYQPQSAYGSGHPILRIDDYQNDWSRPASDLRQLRASHSDIDTYSLRVNDLVINRVNSATHLGKVLLVEVRHTPAVFESNMMRLRLGPVEAGYVALYLRSTDGRRRLTANAKWAVNQASINQGDVGATAVPLPPLSEQQEILADVERRLSLADAATSEVDAALARAAQLRQRLLRHAFEGRLVPQDPSDEPASELLARIQAEKGTAPSGARRSRRPKAEAQAELPL